MSRATVREAIGLYLTVNKGLVPNLSKVYTQPPKFTAGGDFFEGQDPGHGSGAVIYIHLATQHESRVAFGGPTNGVKLRPYTCALICVLRSKEPDPQTVGDENDAFLDGLTALIEEDRNAGNPATIFQWGEGEELYGVDIRVRAEMPRPIRLQMSQVFSVVEVTVLEWLNT